MDRVVYRQNKKEENFSKIDTDVFKFLDNWILKAVLLVVSGILVYSVYKSVNLTSQKLDILRRAEREVEELRLKNLALSIQIREMSTDEYLEKEARDRLNFGENGEIVFVIPDTALELSSERVRQILHPEYTSEKVDSVNVWKEFLLSGI